MELLIVVAIIAILATLLLPSLTRARETAKRAVCASNQNQIHKSYMVFATQNNGKIPLQAPTAKRYSMRYHRRVPEGSVSGGNRGYANIGLMYSDKLITSKEALLCPSLDVNKIASPETIIGIGLELDDNTRGDARTYYAVRPMKEMRWHYEDPKWFTFIAKMDSVAIISEQMYMTLAKGYELAHNTGNNITSLDGSTVWYRADARFFALNRRNFTSGARVVESWEKFDTRLGQ